MNSDQKNVILCVILMFVFATGCGYAGFTIGVDIGYNEAISQQFLDNDSETSDVQDSSLDWLHKWLGYHNKSNDTSNLSTYALNITSGKIEEIPDPVPEGWVVPDDWYTGFEIESNSSNAVCYQYVDGSGFCYGS